MRYVDGLAQRNDEWVASFSSVWTRYWFTSAPAMSLISCVLLAGGARAWIVHNGFQAIIGIVGGVLYGVQASLRWLSWSTHQRGRRRS